MATSEANTGREDQVQLYQLLNFPAPQSAIGGGGGGNGGAMLGHLPPLVRPAGTAETPTRGGSTPASSVPATEGQGRAGKAAARRRQRAASRRTPTTVLSTDAVNFRAMVQQFTGAHPAPFQAGGGGQATLGLGLGEGVAQLRQPTAAFPFGSQQPQQQLLYQNEERWLLPGRSDQYRSAAAGGSDAFLQGYGGKPQRGFAGVPEGFLPESVSPSQEQLTPRSAASMGRWSTANGSLF